MREKSPNRDPFLSMHRLFRRLQQRNRFVSVEPTTQLTLAEAHILTEVAVDPSHTQKTLCALLMLPQSYVSRATDRLEEAGLVERRASPHDGRAQTLVLTKKGTAVLVESDAVTDRYFESFSSKMTQAKKETLVAFFRAIADGYGHPTSRLRPGEPEFRREQRRVTRCFRLLGPTAFGTNLNATQWQVLSELSLSPLPLTAARLSDTLAITPGALSILLKDFEKRGYVERVASRSDRRSVSLSLGSKGAKVVTEVEALASAELRHALRDVTKRQVEEWLSVLSSYVLDTDPTASPHIPGLRIEYLTGEEEKRVARAFLFESLVELRWHHEAPSVLLGDGHIGVGLFRGRELVSIVDVVAGAKRYVVSCAARSRSLGSREFSKHLDLLGDTLVQKFGEGRIVWAFPPLGR